MADLANLVITGGGSVQVTVPSYTISCQMVDSVTGAVIRDFTGANTISFPGVLATLSVARRTAILRAILKDVVLKSAGIDS